MAQPQLPNWTAMNNSLNDVGDNLHAVSNELQKLQNLPVLQLGQQIAELTELIRGVNVRQDNIAAALTELRNTAATATAVRDLSNQLTTGLRALRVEARADKVLEPKDDINALMGIDGAPIQGFPTTLRALRTLTLPRVSAILGRLGFTTDDLAGTNLEARRRLLEDEVGTIGILAEAAGGTT